jgi:glycerol-3-phosphate dehydrogenase
LPETIYDMAIIGGGVNGCGIARDAAGRGLKVLLAEKDDLASGTSSASSKLIHGGLRYLEHYEFSLVRESLKERETLWALAPHIIRPMRFVLPCHRAMRPAWLIRLGLFLYDHLGGRKRLRASHMLDLRKDAAGKPLKAEYIKGFEYSDCAVDDARLVVLNAIDAALRGADIRVASKITKARREAGLWRITLHEAGAARHEDLKARILVNAAGPWVGEMAAKSSASGRAASSLRLVKGSHIVVPKMFDHERAYILQNEDQRIVFVIPYTRDFTLIGTTDVDILDGPGKVEASEGEIRYLCKVVNSYFASPLTPDDVVWSFAGIRPLFDDGGDSAQETTRDYVLELQGGGADAPLMNIYGGKITTYRQLAEDVLDKLAQFFPGLEGNWTRGSSLPGGDFGVEGFEDLLHEFKTDYPFLPGALARRLCHAYGTRVRLVLAGAKSLHELGHHFGAGLYEAEVNYLQTHEWARRTGDIIWRRSKLGLYLSAGEVEELTRWLEKHPGRTPQFMTDDT